MNETHVVVESVVIVEVSVIVESPIVKSWATVLAVTFMINEAESEEVMATMVVTVAS